MKKLIKYYIYGVKCWNTGYGSLVGRFAGIINLSLLISTFLLVKGIDMSIITTITLGIILVVGLLVLGHIYIRIGFLKAETASNFVENPPLVEMAERIKRIEEKMDKLF